MAGGTELTTYLNLIQREKTNKIIPENIKSGIEVLGIIGEYTGIKTYSSVSAMNNDLANIEENEIAKVVVGNITTYYIKNTIMKELYKEEDTISPTDYVQAQEQIDNLFGVADLPYIELEYIQSSGTQYIDTGFKPKGTSRFLANITVLSGEKNVFGAYPSYEGWSSGLGLFGKYNTSWWYHYFGNTDTRYANSTMEIDFSPTYLTLNDRTFNHTSNTSTVNYNLYIFAGNHANTVYYQATMKLTYFKIYDEDILVRDFIPVKRKSDDVICLYDKVSKEFFTNQGTGDFIAGPEID